MRNERSQVVHIAVYLENRFIYNKLEAILFEEMLEKN
jgi:hypothetical protein